MSEADIKLAVAQHLQYGQNQGKWIFLRLNAGDFIEVRGKTRRRVMGCPKGTADYLVLHPSVCGDFAANILAIFIEIKSTRGRQSKEQKEFQAMVEAIGAEYRIVRSVDELEHILGV